MIQWRQIKYNAYRYIVLSAVFNGHKKKREGKY
jgi:hypothetical protein